MEASGLWLEYSSSSIRVSLTSRQLWRKPIIADQVGTRSVFNHERPATVVHVAVQTQLKARLPSLWIRHDILIHERNVPMGEDACMGMDFGCREFGGYFGLDRLVRCCSIVRCEVRAASTCSYGPKSIGAENSDSSLVQVRQRKKFGRILEQNDA
jgi:hypothetical protein